MMASYKKHIFTPIEKKTFVDILKIFSHIVENKNTDGATLAAKKNAWNSLSAEYNASPQVTAQVTSQQLRRLWMNLKHRQRDALTKERQHRMATGGGPSTSDVAIDPDISQVAPALIVGIDEAIDSDTLPVLVTSEEMSEAVLSADSQPPTLARFTVPTPPLPIPSPPPISHTRLPPPPVSFQKLKSTILQNEHEERTRRFNETHEMELLILQEKLREATAKANLAELLLMQEHQKNNTN